MPFNVVIVNESNIVNISDSDLIEGLTAFRENLKFLVEEGIIISMNEFAKVKMTVRILEKELSRRNQERLLVRQHGRFTIYSRKTNG